MKRAHLILLALMAFPVASFAQSDQDDFGTWIELGAEKSLPHNLSVGVNGELRTEDNSTRVDRLSIGVDLGYKVCKYLKVGVGYNFMGSFSPEKRKEHYKDDIEDDAHWNGYKLTESYWTPKHRLSLEASSSVKLWKWLRVSARERYQYTKSASVDGIQTSKYRFTFLNGEPILKDGYPEIESTDKPSESAQYIRSRVKLEVDKKRLDWSPFVSVEFHNSIDHSFHLHKLRTSVGTGYKINRNHSVDMAYTLTNEFDETPNERMHALSVGYKYKF